MKTEDKRNQIKSWFTTPNPQELQEPQEPQELPDQVPSAFEKGSLTFVVCFIVWLFIAFIVWIAQFNWYDYLLASIFVLILLILMTIIMPIRTYIKTKKENRKAKAEAKAKYDAAKAEAKAEYDAAKAKYDALPSTDQMIQWLEEDLENIKMSTLEKARLDKGELEADTVLVRVPIGADGTPISGPNLSRYWHLTILYIGRLSIVVYKCDYNWLSDGLSNESTAEYFYRDVVAVEATSGRFAGINISLRDGNSVGIVLNGQDSEESSNELFKAAGSIRRLLKDEGLKSHLHLTKKDEG